MRGIAIGAIFMLFIVILMPTIIIQSCDILPEEPEIEKNKVELKEVNTIKIYNITTEEVEEMELEEYIKGVVAAEMPAEFNIEALKAQAVAARSFTLYRADKFKDGNPAHPQAPLCTGIHCQAYLSKDELRNVKPKNWMSNYWSKIEEAVESTKGEILTYEGVLIEPLFHSTSGGMTENSEDVFISAQPYHRAVESPNEEASPRFEESKTVPVSEFISKLREKYPSAALSVESLPDKIKVASRSAGGRIKQIIIDNEMISGRDIRTLFGLNSTNFKITLKGNNVTFTTIGNGHGVGMSQWGAQGMGTNGNTYIEILKHYYTGVEITKID